MHRHPSDLDPSQTSINQRNKKQTPIQAQAHAPAQTQAQAQAIKSIEIEIVYVAGHM